MLKNLLYQFRSYQEIISLKLKYGQYKNTMEGITDFFDICHNLYKYQEISDLSRLKHLARQNNQWVYYNETIYFCPENKMEIYDIMDYLRLPQAILEPIINPYTTAPAIIGIPHTNMAYLAIIALIHIYFTLQQPVYILDHPELYHQKYYTALNTLLSTSPYVTFVSLKEGMSLSEIDIDFNRNPLFIIFYDIPPSTRDKKSAYDVDLLHNNIYISDTILRLSRKIKAPMLPILPYTKNTQVKIQTFSPVEAYKFDSNYQSTKSLLRQLMGPLNNLLTIDPSQWLLWKHLEKYRPVEKHNIRRTSKNPIIKLSHGNQICLLNLEKHTKLLIPENYQNFYLRKFNQTKLNLYLKKHGIRHSDQMTRQIAQWIGK